MELEPTLIRFRTQDSIRVPRPVLCRAVGYAVEDSDTPHPRRVLLAALSSAPSHSQETRIFALRAGSSAVQLATVKHADYVVDMMKACGLGLRSRSPPLQSRTDISCEIAVTTATMSPGRAFVAVGLECRLRALAADLAEIPTSTVACMVVLFHPATQQKLVVEHGDRHLVPILTLKGPREPALVIYSTRTAPELESLYQRSPVGPSPATREELRRAAARPGPRSTKAHFTEYKLAASNDSVTIAGRTFKLGGLLKKSIEAVPQSPMFSFRQLQDVLWFQHDPWDRTLISLSALQQNSDGHMFMYHELDAEHFVSKYVPLIIPVMLRPRFDRVHAGMHTGRNQLITVRRWMTRTGCDMFAMQLLERCYGPGIMIHFPIRARTPTALAIACVYFGTQKPETCDFRVHFVQRCLGLSEKCRIMYLSYHGDRDGFFAIDLRRVLEGLSPYFVHEIVRYDRSGLEQGRQTRTERFKNPPPPDMVMPTYTHAPRYSSWGKLGFGDHSRIFLFTHGNPQHAIEIAVPKETTDRATFVRMYGMLAVIFATRPALFIDLETFPRPPQYLFSCPLAQPTDIDGAEASFRGRRSDTESADLSRAASGSRAAVAAAERSPTSSHNADGTRPFENEHSEVRRGRTRHLPSWQRPQYVTLPLSFRAPTEETDRPCESVAESRCFDAPPTLDAGSTTFAPLVFEPRLSFECVVRNVVMPHINAVLSTDATRQHIRLRGDVLKLQSSASAHRTQREAHFLAAYHALAIACSRLVYLPDARLLSFDTVGSMFDLLATAIFKAPASSLRSASLYLAIGFFAEAFQRVAAGRRLAEAATAASAAASSTMQGGSRNSGSEPSHHLLANARNFCGFASKFKTWSEYLPHPELQPVLQLQGVLETKDGGIGAFRHVPPSREHEDIEYNARWMQEAGNPLVPAERVSVQRFVHHLADGDIFFRHVESSPVPPERHWDHTMPNPLAVPVVTPADDPMPTYPLPGGGRRDTGLEASVVAGAHSTLVHSRVEADDHARNRTLHQAEELVRYAVSRATRASDRAGHHPAAVAAAAAQRQAAAAAQQHHHSRGRDRGTSMGAGASASGGGGGSGADHHRGSIPKPVRDLLRDAYFSCETRLKTLMADNGDQLLAHIDIALAMEALHSRSSRDVNPTFRDLKDVMRPAIDRHSVDAGFRRSMASRSAAAVDHHLHHQQPPDAAASAEGAGVDRPLMSLLDDAPLRALGGEPDPLGTVAAGDDMMALPRPLPRAVLVTLARRGLYDLDDGSNRGASRASNAHPNHSGNSEAAGEPHHSHPLANDSMVMTTPLTAGADGRRGNATATGRSPRHGDGHHHHHGGTTWSPASAARPASVAGGGGAHDAGGGATTTWASSSSPRHARRCEASASSPYGGRDSFMWRESVPFGESVTAQRSPRPPTTTAAAAAAVTTHSNEDSGTPNPASRQQQPTTAAGRLAVPPAAGGVAASRSARNTPAASNASGLFPSAALMHQLHPPHVTKAQYFADRLLRPYTTIVS